MSLIPGTRLGPYEVIGSLGAGGMGEVYRARDTKLDRDVALKILPDHFATDPERLARFEREAKTLASLNHPHIAQIYGFEEGPAEAGRHIGTDVASGFSPTRALVMELVEGEDLSQRIARSAIPIDEALPIVRQIADALEAAHDQGIIHRDLKPANVKVRPDGTVKVLDFGLAKALDPAASSSEHVANSPTLTAHATVAGIIIGTAAYMSPEQARGKAVDRRADIWAFGVVCFEMLAGRRAFDGEEISDVLAAVLRQDINWTALPAATPPALKRLLERCLDRDAKQRLRDIGEARVTIDRIISGAPLAIEAPAAPAEAARPVWRRALPAVAVVVASALTGFGVWTVTHPAPAAPLPVQRYPLTLPASVSYGSGPGNGLAVSPDGTRFAYAAVEAGKRLLYLRRLDLLEAEPIRGTDDALNPFFSPDGEWIAYFTPPPETKLRKVAVNGGPPVTLAENTGSVGAWLADGTVAFTRPTEQGWALARVPAAGGAAHALTTPDAANYETRHAFPEPLPGGNDILFSVFGGANSLDSARVAVLSLSTGKYRTIIENGYHARFVPNGPGSPNQGDRDDGHLVFMQDDNLMAVPFEVARLETTGPPVLLVEGMRVTANGEAGFAVSTKGLLVYARQMGSVGNRTLVWVDRSGRQEPVGAPSRNYLHLRLSPDGTRIALGIRDQQEDVWVWDLARQNLVRLTFERSNRSPLWTKDGRRILFSSTRANGVGNLYWQAADGSGQAERLIESRLTQAPNSVSPDGARLLFVNRGARLAQSSTGDDIATLSLDDRRMTPLIQTPYNEQHPEISPDGGWLAYQSDESGVAQIYVRPFPDVDSGRWQVSTDGGTRPTWARNGRELFYLAPASGGIGNRVMAVPIQGGPTFSAGAPLALFEAPFLPGGNARPYDISADGQRFLMIKEGTDQAAASGPAFVFVVNWFDELRSLAQPR